MEALPPPPLHPATHSVIAAMAKAAFLRLDWFIVPSCSRQCGQSRTRRRLPRDVTSLIDDSGQRGYGSMRLVTRRVDASHTSVARVSLVTLRRKKKRPTS